VSESVLARAMRLTSSLNYDDLRQLLACIRYHHGVLAQSNTGGENAQRCHELAAAAQSDDSPNALLLTAYAAMSQIATPADMLALQQMVETLVNALTPQVPHDDPRGYLEMRWIPRLRWNAKSGILRVWYGPYAYLRYRTSDTQDVYKAIYLGRDIADMYNGGRMSLRAILDAYEQGDIKVLKRTAKAQQPDIPQSALPDPPQPPVPFDLHTGFIGLVNENKLKRYDVVKLYTPLILNALEMGIMTQADFYIAYRDGNEEAFRRDLKRQLGTDED